MAVIIKELVEMAVMTLVVLAIGWLVLAAPDKGAEAHREMIQHAADADPQWQAGLRAAD
jgi:hypothetical protein